MKRATLILCCVVVAASLFWLFPIFQIVQLDTPSVATASESFNAADFAQSFWNERLLPSLDQAADADAFLSTFHDDPQKAREKFGRRASGSRMRLVVLKGSGRILTLDKKEVGIAIAPEATKPEITLQTGLLFGNTVRDMTGFLDASNFLNSQQFNEVSSELNRIVESRVFPSLNKPAVFLDQQIEFVGCAEIPDDTPLALPLKLIPLVVRSPANIERPLLSDGPHVR